MDIDEEYRYWATVNNGLVLWVKKQEHLIRSLSAPSRFLIYNHYTLEKYVSVDIRLLSKSYIAKHVSPEPNSYYHRLLQELDPVIRKSLKAFPIQDKVIKFVFITDEGESAETLQYD